MVWAPLALAAGLGVIISAGLYLVVVWPGREPPDDSDSDSDSDSDDGAA